MAICRPHTGLPARHNQQVCPKGLIRKKAKLRMSSAEGRQDRAGSMKEKGPAGHIGKKVS